MVVYCKCRQCCFMCSKDVYLKIDASEVPFLLVESYLALNKIKEDIRMDNVIKLR